MLYQSFKRAVFSTINTPSADKTVFIIYSNGSLHYLNILAIQFKYLMAASDPQEIRGRACMQCPPAVLIWSMCEGARGMQGGKGGGGTGWYTGVRVGGEEKMLCNGMLVVAIWDEKGSC